MTCACFCNFDIKRHRIKPIEWSKPYELVEGSGFWSIRGTHPLGNYDINWQDDTTGKIGNDAFSLMYGLDTQCTGYGKAPGVIAQLKSFATSNMKKRLESVFYDDDGY